MTRRSRAPGAFVAVLAVLVLGVVAGPGLGRAQTGSVPAVLAGHWRYDGSAARAMQIVEAAFEPGIRTFPELFQGFARSRIRASMVPPSTVDITLSGSHVRVALETDRTMIIDGELGATAAGTGIEGGAVVSTALSSGWLQVRYDGEGDMQQLFSAEADGSRMHVDFTVVSDQLPNPVRYRLDYVPR